MSVLAQRQRVRTWMFLSPSVALLLVFMVGPVIWAIYIAFTNLALTGPTALHPQFVGVGNFVTTFHDVLFYNSALASLEYLVGSGLVGQVILGLILALLMQSPRRRFKGVLATIVVAAWVVPEIVVAFLWYAFLGYPHGLANVFLILLGVPPVQWLYSAPMVAIIVANTWRGTGFSMLSLSAAIGSISPDLFEAAAIDGATAWQRFWRIVLPLIKNTLATNLLLITLWTLSDFTLVFVLTGGGPGFATDILPIYIYQKAFTFYELGYGTAISLLLLAIGAILSLLYLRVLRVEI
jgi:multiple sugar transport system permease protein